MLQIAGWRLRIARDGFSGAVACRLAARDRRALYRQGAVGFRFTHHRDVALAQYRIDGGVPRAARDDLPMLLRLAVPVDRGAPGNAAQGIVWIPYSDLARATIVVIAPSPGTALAQFRLDGLAALHDRAVASGCTPDSRFIE